MTKLEMLGIISRSIGECGSLKSSTVKSLEAILVNLEDEKCLRDEPSNMTKQEIIADLTKWYGEDFSGLEKVSKTCLDRLYTFFKL